MPLSRVHFGGFVLIYLPLFEMWDRFIRLIIIADLFMNFFFHCLQFKRFCVQQNSMNLVVRKLLWMETKLNGVEEVTLDISSRMGTSGLGSDRSSEDISA